MSAIIYSLFGGKGFIWGELAQAKAKPQAILIAVVTSSIIPLIEEFGWRGYVLDVLREKYNALKASLILGVFWSGWHLPMFFIKDSFQASLGVGTFEFWTFFIFAIPVVVVMTWIYENTERSTLGAIIFHASINFSCWLIAVNRYSGFIYHSLWLLVAIIIVAVYGVKNFSKDVSSSEKIQNCS